MDSASGVYIPERLELRLFGSMELSRGGLPLTELNAGKTVALLIYLAVTGTPHTRSALAGLLWGGMPEEKARANLSKALSTLRRTVGEHVLIERQSAAVDRRSPYWLDVEEFEREATSAAVERQQAAVSLYRGDFLCEFNVRDAPEFEEWMFAQQSRLRELALDTLQTLSIHFAAQGETGHAAAIHHTTHLLQLAPWREDAHRQMMRLLALRGQRGSALAQYERCRQALADELDVAPSAETMALYEQIRTGVFEEAAGARSSPAGPLLAERAPAAPGFLRSTDTASPTDMSHFVARETELAQMHRCLDQALAGQGNVVFVTGDAGSGKTALLREFARQALTRDASLIVVGGNCNAYGGEGDPYLPFREILHLLTGDVESGWNTGAISGELARRLWALALEAIQTLVDEGACLLDVFVSGAALARRAAQMAPAATPGTAQLAGALAQAQTGQRQANLGQVDLFEAFTRTMQALARHRPLVLVLDDLQWADAGSISLLFHMGRRLVGRRILVVGAFRPDEVALGRDGGRHLLEPVVNEFQRLFGNRPLDMQQSEDNQFVRRILETEANRLGPEFEEALHRHTQGHALFTVEILRGMQERGDLVRDAQGQWIEGTNINWDELPPRVDGVIAERIARLPEPLQATLRIAAVEGEFFTAEVAAGVQGLDDTEIFRQLSRELGPRHRLVHSLGSEQRGSQRLSRYRFQHILIQKYVYNSLDSVERVHLHAQVGRRLEQCYTGDTGEIAGQLARHFQAAGLLQEALAYWRQAGDVAARLYANAEAIGHYRRALALARQLDAPGETMTAIYTRLGRTLELDSQFDQALATYGEMEHSAHQRDDKRMKLAALLARMAIQAPPTAVHDAVRAQTLGKRALALARQLNDEVTEAQALWILSLACYFDNQLSQAIDCGERSLVLARRLNLRSQMAQTLNDLGSFCYMYSGHLTQAKEALLEAIALWRETENLPMLTDSLASVTVAHVYAGEFKQAQARSEEAHQLSQSIGNVWGQSYSRCKIGLAYWEQGEGERAIAAMEESIRLGEAAGFLIPQTNTRADLAALYGEVGAVEQGLETIQLSLAAARAQNPVQTGPGLGVLARLQLFNDDVAAAQASIDLAHREPYQETWPVFFVPVAFAEVELRLKMADFPVALAAAEALLSQLRQMGMRIHLAHALYLRGQALQGVGCLSEAHTSFAEARTEAAAVGSRRTEWRIFEALSKLEPDPSRAEALRQRARRAAEYIATHLGEEHTALQRSFLNLPDVRALLP